MWSYILIFIGVAISTTLMMYIDSRLFDKPKTRITYIKTIAMNTVITFAIIYILTWLSPTKKIGDVVQSAGSQVKISGVPTTFVSQIGEDMIAGDAPF
jgi:fluoride ion exporter CrcB/FEX